MTIRHPEEEVFPIKKWLSLTLALVLMMSCMLAAPASAITASDLRTQLNNEASGLSTGNKCPQQPTVYCAPRYQDLGAQPQNLKRGLSASQIDSDQSGREYGLYFKFTPRGKNQTYLIERFDVTIHDSKGNLVYVEGFDATMQCQPRYYWYWNFFNLAGLFENLKTLNGSITPGKYVMNIYFNRLWAGKTNFTIKK